MISHLRYLAGQVAFTLVLLASGIAYGQPESVESILVDGDVLLQRSLSAQSVAIEEASGSPLTHVGLYFQREGEPWVIEAVGPVRWVRLDDWIAQGEEGWLVVARHEGVAVLSEEALSTVRREAESFLGTQYDLLFEWSDDVIYCSELVYKAFERGVGLEVGVLTTLGELELDGDAVQALIGQRMATDPNLEELIVTLGSVLDDPDVSIVYSTDPAFRATE